MVLNHKNMKIHHLWLLKCTKNPLQIQWLVPNETLYKGTSKNHKMDEKSPILRCTFIHQCFIQKKSIPLHTSPIQLCSGIYIYINPYVVGETCTAIFQFFCLVLTHQKYLSLLRALIFCFILVHTQVRQVRKYYIIIYTIKKHHFTWTSVFNSLIGPLLFL